MKKILYLICLSVKHMYMHIFNKIVKIMIYIGTKTTFEKIQ